MRVNHCQGVLVLLRIISSITGYCHVDLIGQQPYHPRCLGSNRVIKRFMDCV